MSIQQMFFASLASGGDFVINGSGLWAGVDDRLLLTPSSAPSSTTIKSGRIIFKLTSIGAEQTLLQAHVDGSNWTQIKLFATNELGFEVVDSGSETLLLKTTQVLRDFSSWYVLDWFYDSSVATPSASSIGMALNGVTITDFATATYPSQNVVCDFGGNGVPMYIGAYNATSKDYSGYIAGISLYDGTKYGPANSGETTDDGYWQINDVSGLTFGDNGFLLSGGSAISAGTDSSGNSNNFSKTGSISSVNESPTNGDAE
tara:strand:- start:716 stop:1492 length:777 start_codon:yes stop_codon:yes gene_type:complete